MSAKARSVVNLMMELEPAEVRCASPAWVCKPPQLSSAPPPMQVMLALGAVCHTTFYKQHDRDLCLVRAQQL